MKHHVTVFDACATQEAICAQLQQDLNELFF